MKVRAGVDTKARRARQKNQTEKPDRKTRQKNQTEKPDRRARQKNQTEKTDRKDRQKRQKKPVPTFPNPVINRVRYM